MRAMSDAGRRDLYLILEVLMGIAFLALAEPCLAGVLVYEKSSGEISAYYQDTPEGGIAPNRAYGILETTTPVPVYDLPAYRIVDGKVVPKLRLMISADSDVLPAMEGVKTLFRVSLLDADGMPVSTSAGDRVRVRIDTTGLVSVGERCCDIPDTAFLQNDTFALPPMIVIAKSPQTEEPSAVVESAEAVFSGGVAVVGVVSTGKEGDVYLQVTKDGTVPAILLLRFVK